jgi:hypothetical protein
MPNSPIPANAEGMPKSRVVPFPAEAAKKHREADLTNLIADMVNMSSVLATLLEDRIRDTGMRSLEVDCRDASNIQFIATQAAAYAERVREAWEKI